MPAESCATSSKPPVGYSVQHRRMLGIIPTARLGLYDEDMVSGLADRVTEALRNAIDDRPADPRPLAVGLLAVQAQMPVIFSFIENSRHREELREMTFAAIEPILGLHQAIQNRFTDIRSSVGEAAAAEAKKSAAVRRRPRPR